MIRMSLTATTCVALLAAPAAAFGGTDVFADVAGDVQDTTESQPVDPAIEPGVDVIDSVVRHSARRITVSVKVADLRDTPGRRFTARIATPTRGGYVLSYDRSHQRDVVRLGAFFGGGNIAYETCRGMAGELNLETDTATWSMPRSCLFDPDWIRVGTGIFADIQRPDGTITSYVDDGRSNGDLQRPRLRGRWELGGRITGPPAEPADRTQQKSTAQTPPTR
jgi:hypothetical protein